MLSYTSGYDARLTVAIKDDITAVYFTSRANALVVRRMLVVPFKAGSRIPLTWSSK